MTLSLLDSQDYTRCIDSVAERAAGPAVW